MFQCRCLLCCTYDERYLFQVEITWKTCSKCCWDSKGIVDSLSHESSFLGLVLSSILPQIIKIINFLVNVTKSAAWSHLSEKSLIENFIFWAVKIQKINLKWLTSIPLEFSLNFDLFSFAKNRKLNIPIPRCQKTTLSGITSRMSTREWVNETLKRYVIYP